MKNYKDEGDYYSFTRSRYKNVHPKSLLKVEILKGVVATFGEPKSKLYSRKYQLVKLEFSKRLYNQRFLNFFWKRFHIKYIPVEKTQRKLPPIYRVVGSKKRLVKRGYIVICDQNNLDRETMINQTSYDYWIKMFNSYSEVSPDAEIPKAAIASLLNKIALNNQVLKEIPTTDWRVFEEIVAEIFRGFNYEVVLTKQSRDGGKDIIALQKINGEVKQRLLIECKHWKGKIDVKPVRELIGVAVQEDDLPTGIILATTSEFTEDAGLLKEKPINSTSPIALDLKDCEDVLEWVGDYSAMVIAEEEIESYIRNY